MKGALIFLINYLNHHQFNRSTYTSTRWRVQNQQGLILLSIFFLSGILELFFVCLSRVILSGGDKINETLFEYKTDTNLSRRSIFYFKLLSFTLFAVIDSAHIPQIVIAAIILFNIHSALKNLKKVRKVTRNFFAMF